MTPEMSAEMFDRLSALEQSHELLRRAQFLDTSSRARHADAIDRHERMLAQLADITTRQQEMQSTLLQMMVDMRDRMTQNETRITQNEAMLQRLIDIQRHRNGS